MADSHPKTTQRRAKTTERVTFVIKAKNRADVLARVVGLFQDLNLEIEAIYMIRRRSSETLRIHVTIETNEPGRQQVEARLEKILNVTTVETGRGGKNLLTEPSDGESSSQFRS